MTQPTSHLGLVQTHRQIWRQRPELREVYGQFFRRLRDAACTSRPVVELGAGPGFLKESWPGLISTDVAPTSWIDVVCDGCNVPFSNASIGTFVMLDVLHHLPRPLEFMAEAARALAPSGRIVAIEPWITPASWILYKCFHHEECRLRVDIHRPFELTGKRPYDGNATIPYLLVRALRETAALRLQLVRKEPFLGLPYLATLGFKRAAPLPQGIGAAAARVERLLGPIGRWNATRALLVWEKV